MRANGKSGPERTVIQASLLIGLSFLPLMASAVVTTFSYGPPNPPVTIPDNNAGGVNVILPVSILGDTINDLNFRLDGLPGCSNMDTDPDTKPSVTHTFLSDLRFRLTSPMGTAVVVITQRGNDGNNFCTVLLDDDGGFPAVSTMPGTGGVNGSFAPENPLSAFDGEVGTGNWVLNIADLALAETGTFNRFSLIIDHGVGTPAGNLTVTPASVSFGNQNVGTSSAASTVTLANTGTAALTVSALTPAGAPFSRSGGTCSAVPITIAAASSCTLDFTFSPTAAGASNQTLAVTVTAPATGSTSIPLSGTGVAVGVAPNFVATPVTNTSLNFPGFSIGGAVATRSVNIANTGNGSGTVTCAISTQAAAPATFTIAPSATQTIGPGANLDFVISFASTAVGNYSGVMTCTPSLGNIFTYPLSASSVAQSSIPVFGTRGMSVLLMLVGMIGMVAMIRRSAQSRQTNRC